MWNNIYRAYILEYTSGQLKTYSDNVQFGQEINRNTDHHEVNPPNELWNVTSPSSIQNWFQLVNAIKTFESMELRLWKQAGIRWSKVVCDSLRERWSKFSSLSWFLNAYTFLPLDSCRVGGPKSYSSQWSLLDNFSFPQQKDWKY